MAKLKFREPNIKTTKRKQMLHRILEFIKQYEAMGIHAVTSRQLYYRLVANDVIPNTKQSYQNLTTLLTDARYWGLIDWDFIVDLGREPIVTSDFTDAMEFTDRVLPIFRFDRWEGQSNRVEVWVEKQALQSILAPIGRQFHVPIVVNKGYTSASSMYRSAMRLRYWQKQGHKVHVIYCGDQDPSGEDMVRDITERLGEFGVRPTLDITKLALTLDQVEHFECPPNPAKTTDSRFKGYAEAMMDNDIYARICDAQGLTVDSDDVYSWEVDAIPPAEFDRMVRERVESFITRPELVDDIKAREERFKRRYRKVIHDGVENGIFDDLDSDDPDNEMIEEEEE